MKEKIKENFGIASILTAILSVGYSISRDIGNIDARMTILEKKIDKIELFEKLAKK
jgi:hypothetical protein